MRNIVCLDSTPGENNPNDLSIIDFNDDNEGQAWPTDATIRVNNGVRVRIQGASMGSLALPGPTNPAGSPFLALGPIGKSTPGAVKGHADLENVAPYGPPIGGAAMIRVEDPDWCVVVRNSTACTGIYGYLQDLTGGRCSARIEHLDLGSIPPRWGTVWAGKHEVRSSPLPGQYAEWRCLVGGTHGSGSLPVWAGLYPNVAPRSNQIAAYSMSYIGVVGEPFLNGVLNDTIVDSLIRRVFGRSPWNPPVAVDASLHVGLISLYRFARDPKQFTEASSPSIQEIRIRNNAGITGGTFRLSFKGRSTPPLAAHSASGEILRALEASPSVGERNVHVENNNVYLDNSNKMVITFKNDLGSEDQPLVTIDASGLRGKDFSFETVSIARGGGYGRAAASFSKAARGSASNSGPIRFPAPSGPWNQGYPIHFWMLTTGSKPSSGTMMIAGELKNHVVIDKPNSAALGFDAGSLGVVHHASTQGGFTHHAADLVLNAILHGSAIEPPATWHIGLSATPVDPSGAGVVEPSGNGYSRIAVPNTHDHWIYNPFRFVAGAACNKSPIRFADPAGAWAEGRPLPHWFLADSPRGGTIWASGTFPVPVVVADRSDAAPNFAPETFFVILI